MQTTQWYVITMFPAHDFAKIINNNFLHLMNTADPKLISSISNLNQNFWKYVPRLR